MILIGNLLFLLYSYIIACGYNLDDDTIAKLNEFLDTKKSLRIDLNTLLMTLTNLKEIELMNEQENEADEYCMKFLILILLFFYSGCLCCIGWSS